MLKRSWGGEINSVSVLAAIGVDSEGYRRILGVFEGHKEDKAGWGFLRTRGLGHAQESREAAEGKSKGVVDKRRAMKLRAAAERVEKSIHETLAYSAYPPQHGLKIKTNNPTERLLKEARRRTKVVVDSQTATTRWIRRPCSRLHKQGAGSHQEKSAKDYLPNRRNIGLARQNAWPRHQREQMVQGRKRCAPLFKTSRSRIPRSVGRAVLRRQAHENDRADELRNLSVH